MTMAALAMWALWGDSAPGSRQQGLEPFATGVVKKEKFVRSLLKRLALLDVDAKPRMAASD